MALFLLALIISYGGLIRFLHNGWLKAIDRSQTLRNNSIQRISVIVPVRNEEANIALLIDDLVAQHYPHDKFEVIIVDDDSEDKSKSIVEDKIKVGRSIFKIVSNNGKGKKSAITTGIELAKGDIIVTTDGDCRIMLGWLQSINDAFTDAKIKMVFGPVRIKTDATLFSSIQAIEFSSLIGTGAATNARGIPTMCNGANLAFRKDNFFEVNGYEGNNHIASGDDEFLMRKIKRNYPEGIIFNKAPGSLVLTCPQKTVLSFTSQRLRWAGKWKSNNDVRSKILAAYVFIFHVTVLASPFLVLVDNRLGYFALALLITKFILEYKFIRSITAWIGVKWNWFAFIALQITYSLYVVTVGLSSFFVRPGWKGRK